MKRYQAFGLSIESDIELPQVPLNAESGEVDVSIRISFLPEKDYPAEGTYIAKNDIRFTVEGLARLRITDGRLIEVCPLLADTSALPVYLLGSCMGAIFHQRGLFPLHGSCVSDGERTYLITGDSGAGKSTLASVFLQHGWQLLTDDVAVILDPEGVAFVQPSYPSQKLWADSPEMENRNEKDIHSLYQRDEQVKYGVSVGERFAAQPRPLTRIVRLIASPLPTQVRSIDGFARVDQLMQNTYREFMILRENLERHFQRCVTLSTKVPMVLALRNQAEESRERLYELLTGEESNNTEEEISLLIRDTTLLKRKEDIISADMQGSVVTMDIQTGKYYDLGETGGAIWNLLSTEMTCDQLIEAIMAEYEVSREQCEADVKSFLVKLIADGLVLANG